MNGLSETKQIALKQFLEALKILREEGVLINKKDFTCQLGEWIVETVYDGKRAISGIQKGWDVDVKGHHIQVKAHAKATTNSAKFSVVSNKSIEKIDELIIVVFTADYKLERFYKIPWMEALKHIHPRGEAKRPELNWSDVERFRQELHKIPRQDIIQFFR
jgi:hypothetical protein